MTSKRKAPARRRPAPPEPAFTPAAPRARHDGWTPERQVAFIEALAESGCVREACGTVGLSPRAAYTLRARTDAQGFRIAWDAALDYAIRRLSDECLSRALHGVAVPVFYQGQQIGEHRRYDNRLAMFLLRYRDPLRYAATLDQMVYAGDVEGAAIRFAKARDRVAEEAWGVADTPVEADALPFTTTPLQDERVRQGEEALIRSDAPIHGDSARRDRLNRRRHAYHVGRMSGEQRRAMIAADEEAAGLRRLAEAEKDYVDYLRGAGLDVGPGAGPGIGSEGGVA